MKKPDESNAKHHDKVNWPRASLNWKNSKELFRIPTQNSFV
jgi:hypothetical protein